jgi:hypothetical protein
VSAARRYRRQAQRTSWRLLQRRFDHELSAGSRAWVDRMIKAHDDPDVDLNTYRALGQQFATYMAAVDDDERNEACLQIHQHASRALTGRPQLTAVGWLTPPTDTQP